MLNLKVERATITRDLPKPVKMYFQSVRIVKKDKQ